MARPAPLSAAERDAFLARAPHWALVDGALTRAVTAPSFLEGIAWVESVAQVAERMDHHPDIDIRWRTITFRLSTHDVGAITELDTRLAQAIDAVVDGAP